MSLTLWRCTLRPEPAKCVPGRPGASQAIPRQGFRFSPAWACERDWSGTALRGPATLHSRRPPISVSHERSTR